MDSWQSFRLRRGIVQSLAPNQKKIGKIHKIEKHRDRYNLTLRTVGKRCPPQAKTAGKKQRENHLLAMERRAKPTVALTKWPVF